jgi:hypothetical protein
LQTATICCFEEQKSKNNHGTAFDVQLARYCLVGDTDLAKKNTDQFATNRLFTQLCLTGHNHKLERTTALGYSGC